MRRQARPGTKIRVLIIAVLLVSFVAYQLLIPIDDPSLDGPDNSVTLSANTDQPGEAQHVQHRGEHQVYWGDLHIHTSLRAMRSPWVFGQYPMMSIASLRRDLGTWRRIPRHLTRPLDFAAVDHAEYLGRPSFRFECSHYAAVASDILRRENRLT